MNSASRRCSHGGAGRRIGKNVEFEFLYDEVPRLPPVLPRGSWQEVAGAGSQGTEPRSMIWDGTLTDSIRKICKRVNSGSCRRSHGGAGRRINGTFKFESFMMRCPAPTGAPMGEQVGDGWGRQPGDRAQINDLGWHPD